MGLLDIFGKKKRSKADEKLKRPKKGALNRPAKKLVQSPSGIEAGKEQSSELGSRVILSPHITEKSTMFSERGVYVFKAAPGANKIMVKKSIKELYGFVPRKISVVNMPGKTRILRGKPGYKPGFKKVLVYLKKGDSIDLA